MPVVFKDNCYFLNPVMGTFIRSIKPYFKEITIFSFSKKNDELLTYKILKNKNLKIIDLGLKKGYWDYFNKIFRIKKILNNLEADLLFIRMPTALFYLIIKSLNKPKFLIMLFVANPVNESDSTRNKKNIFIHIFIKFRSLWKNRLLKKVLNNSKTLLLSNSYDLKLKWENITKKHFNMIHTSSISKNDIIDFIDIDKHKYSNNAKIKLLFLGRVEVDKGIIEAIKSVSLLNYKYKVNSTLKIVGQVQHMSKDDLTKIIYKYSANEFVEIIGPVTFGRKLLKIYKNAHYFLMPSYHEGMPKVIWESLSQGTPVISTNVGGISNFLSDKEEIYFVSKRNAESIAKGVLDLSNDIGLRNKLISNGLKKVFNYTLENQGLLLHNHMKSFITSK